MSQGVSARVERAIIVLMLLGMAGMFQPLSIDLYRYGFLLLLLSTILFIIISHIKPKRDGSDAGPISVEQAVEHGQRHNP
jgi:hypothetical protein